MGYEIMSRTRNIFVINLGSTSSKVAICRNESIVKQRSASRHKRTQELKTPEGIVSFYKRIVIGFLEDNGIDLAEFDALAVRGVEVGELSPWGVSADP